MMGIGHALGAPVMVLGLGLAVDWTGRATGVTIPPAQVAVAAALAVPFAFGRLSPDADQRKPVKKLVGGHRQTLHWWGWPVAAIAAIMLGWPLLLGGWAPFWAYGPALGWLSHIWPWDWIFGKGGRNIPRGIPRWPVKGSPRHGLGLRVSPQRSRVEQALIGSRRQHAILEWIVTASFLPVLWWEWQALGGVLAPG